MSVRVLTAGQVDAAAQAGVRELAVEPGTLVTPLARDRAAALGVTIRDGPGPTDGGSPPGRELRRRGRSGVDLDRLVLESRVRILARRALLRRGQGLGALEDLVAAVMTRLYSEVEACPCGGGPR